jgi:hypothetical protein
MRVKVIGVCCDSAGQPTLLLRLLLLLLLI